MNSRNQQARAVASPVVAIAHPDFGGMADAYRTALSGKAELMFVHGLDGAARETALRSASVLACFAPFRELQDADYDNLNSLRMVQCLATGLDEFPFERFPDDVLIAGNRGAAGRWIAEHAVASTLASAKRLMARHCEMKQGEFHQSARHKPVHGSTALILGLGDIGGRVAALLKPFGVSIIGLNRSGRPDSRADRTVSIDDLMSVLPLADVIIIALSLNDGTRGLIGSDQLAAMKPDATLVNVARADIIDQRALYAHLKDHRDFHAALDVWWKEPLRHGRFSVDHPFFDLPNLIGTPHNAPMVPGIEKQLAECAAHNIRRFLTGEEPANLEQPSAIGESDVRRIHA